MKSLENEVAKLKKEIIAKNKQIEKLSHMVLIDKLTGIFNRDGFKKEVKRFIKAIKKDRILEQSEIQRRLSIGNISILFIDLDDFKKINDDFGHTAGDKFLKEFSKALSGVVRDIDIVGRWSGDEFVIALIGSNKNQSSIKIPTIKKDIDNKIKKKNIPSTSATFGISSVFDEKREKKWVFDIDDLIKEADLEMLEKKRMRKRQ